jgi:translocator protein
MTTFIPSLTLPAAVFANPAASILLPIGLGTAVGFSVQRMYQGHYISLPFPWHLLHQANILVAKQSQKTYMALKQPPYRPPPQIFGPTWAILYGLMGYSAYRAYSTGMHPMASTEKQLLTKHGATLYTIQLGYVLSQTNLYRAWTS